MQSGAIVHFIEDDSNSRFATQALLEVAGWQVATYGTAEDFLATVDLSATGCVLADYRLPGLSGLQIFQILRQRGITLPVLLLSGHAEPPVVEAALAEGVSEFLLKPVTPQQLRTVMQKYLPVESAK